MSLSNIFQNNEWIIPTISAISIVISIIMTIRSFNKQKLLHVDHERLEYVYFPLISFIKSCEEKRNMRAFDLYWYLKDKLMDEKYKALLGIANINNHFEKLENYCLSNENFDVKKENSLFYTITDIIDRNYTKIKIRAGYASKTRKYAFTSFAVFYICFLSYGFLITEGNITENTPVAYFTNLLLVISSFSFFLFILFRLRIIFFEGGIYEFQKEIKSFFLSSKIIYSHFASFIKKRVLKSQNDHDKHIDSPHDKY